MGFPPEVSSVVVSHRALGTNARFQLKREHLIKIFTVHDKLGGSGIKLADNT